MCVQTSPFAKVWYQIRHMSNFHQQVGENLNKKRIDCNHDNTTVVDMSACLQRLPVGMGM